MRALALAPPLEDGATPETHKKYFLQNIVFCRLFKCDLLLLQHLKQTH